MTQPNKPEFHFAFCGFAVIFQEGLLWRLNWKTKR